MPPKGMKMKNLHSMIVEHCESVSACHPASVQILGVHLWSQERVNVPIGSFLLDICRPLLAVTCNYYGKSGDLSCPFRC